MTEFSWSVRVYYEDTDAGGVVYNANYLKFLERARTEMLRELGFEQDRLMNEAEILFAVRKITIEYLKPAYFNELLKVNVKIAEIRKASILFHQSILNQNDILICEAEVRIACMNKQSMKSIPIPGYILSELKA